MSAHFIVYKTKSGARERLHEFMDVVSKYGNSGFLAFVQRSGLPFQSHTQFKKADVASRQKLYPRIAEQLWSTARVGEAAV